MLNLMIIASFWQVLVPGQRRKFSIGFFSVKPFINAISSLNTKVCFPVIHIVSVIMQLSISLEFSIKTEQNGSVFLMFSIFIYFCMANK